MNQDVILKSAIVGAKIVELKREELGYQLTLNNGNIVMLTPLLDRGVDKIQACIKVSVI